MKGLGKTSQKCTLEHLILLTCQTFLKGKKTCLVGDHSSSMKAPFLQSST